MLDWGITHLMRPYLKKIKILPGLSISGNLVVIILKLSVSAPGDV
jgi:hypothetical protein